MNNKQQSRIKSINNNWQKTMSVKEEKPTTMIDND